MEYGPHAGEVLLHVGLCLLNACRSIQEAVKEYKALKIGCSCLNIFSQEREMDNCQVR